MNKCNFTSEELNNQTWKDIPNFPNYKVSDLGLVFSLLSNKYLKQTYLNYCTVNLYNEGKAYTKAVHTLVLTAFIGEREYYEVCRHLDGNPENNRLLNLNWGTQLENMQDTILHGTRLYGENHPNAILTDEKVYNIKLMYYTRSIPQADIAKLLKLNYNVVNDIITGRKWKHIELNKEDLEKMRPTTVKTKLGLNNPNAVLTKAKILQIIFLYRIKNITRKNIAILYDLTPSTVGKLLTGQTYSNIKFDFNNKLMIRSLTHALKYIKN